jgi:stage IV sporulation protein FB
MISFLDTPASSRGEWRFRIFDIPVRVHPWFWFTTLFMGASQDPGATLIWVAVCFVSILLHEVGHVVAFRFFGIRGDVVMYGFGGMAVPESELRGTFARIAVPAAGPAAGFLLAIATLGCAAAAGSQFHLGFHTVVVPSVSAWVLRPVSPYWNILLADLLFVNIFWGLVNLLPIYPLDGGQAARAIFEVHDPIRGRRRSLFVSMIVGVVMALLGLLTRSMYLVALFGVLAAGSAQALEADRPMFKPSGSRR